MNDAMWDSLGWAVGLLALFSFLAVSAWVTNRRQEREAFYKSEAIKKVAEMQGVASEPVLAMLREALSPPAAPPPSPMTWVSTNYRREREAFYRTEALKRMADSTGTGTEMMLQFLREEERNSQRRVRGGLLLAGLITAGVGIGSMVFLYLFDPIPDKPVYLAGIIPTLVGVALLAYSHMLPKVGPA